MVAKPSTLTTESSSPLFLSDPLMSRSIASATLARLVAASSGCFVFARAGLDGRGYGTARRGEANYFKNDMAAEEGGAAYNKEGGYREKEEKVLQRGEREISKSCT